MSAAGALMAVGVPRAVRHTSFLRLQSAFGDELIGLFNNAQETVEPVLAAFDRAIATGETSRNRSVPERRAIADQGGGR
jgi:hypothetical protein